MTCQRRRFVGAYQRGLQNLFQLYLPLATSWRVVNNGESPLRLVAKGERGVVASVSSEASLVQIKQAAEHAS